MIDLIISVLPFVVGPFLLYPGMFKRIFAKAKELNHNAVIQEETDRRTALLNEMKKLGYNIDELTPEELDQLRALLKQEFPVLYEDKE